MESASINWDKRFLGMAQLIASWSRDPSTKVGAVIVDSRKRVLSLGYNGFPQDMPDTEVLYSNREEKYSRIIHAEVNALIFARGGISPGSTLYTWPFLPCDRCVVQLLQAGVKRFVAPAPTDDQITRWGAAFERTKKYILECKGAWTEYTEL